MVTLQSLLRDKAFYRDVAQLVAHYVRDVGVGRSSRLFPTEREDIFYILSFFAKPHKRNVASFRQKREDIFYILSFFVQSLISEIPPLSYIAVL